MVSFKHEDCSHRIETDAWVPLEHMLGIVNKPRYHYCTKYKAECRHMKEGKTFCSNCHFHTEDGFFCRLCNHIKNRDVFNVSNKNLKVILFRDCNINNLYSTNLHVLDFDKTIEWVKTFNPKKKVTLVYNRYWYISPSPGYHLVYDYREVFDSYITTYA